MPHDLNPAWIAGFLDGEGSFQIRPQRSSRDRHQTSTVATVSVSQAAPRLEVLQWLKDRYGGCIASHGTERRGSNNNISKRWSVTGAAAVRVCEDVMPHLLLKRRHAELIIEHQATKLSSHIGCRKGLSRAAIRVPSDICALRLAHIEEITRLNQRGVAA